MNAPSSRMIGFDMARAFAMLGMMIVNFKTVMNAGENGPDWLIAFASMFEGRASAVFVVLAGVGISLMTRKARTSKDAVRIQDYKRTIRRRSLFLFTAGMLLCFAGWSGDILHYYGLYMLIASFLLMFSNRKLLVGFMVFLFTAQLLQIALNYWQGWNPLLPFMDYLDFWTIEGFLRNLLYNGYHPLFPWFCFFLLGMWLGRQNMMDRAYRNKMLGYSLAAAVVLEIVAFFLIKGSSLAVGLDAAQFLFSTKTYPPNLFYILSSSSTAVAVIVICIYFAEKFAAHWFTVTMVRTGQLTLTHYVSHVFIGIGLLAVLGKLENQTLKSSLFYSCAFFSGQLFVVLPLEEQIYSGPA
ncbi:DUF418 domain-containing protein [Paenibacillus apiarius]|uniref:DUF418 domain-containing protein n=1 Tax=Paenibacillus apiarius TaxID=46240 RepID=UPI003B3BA0D3